jgi:hypothetical protein
VPNRSPSIQSCRAWTISSWLRPTKFPPHHQLLRERLAAEQQQPAGLGGRDREFAAAGAEIQQWTDAEGDPVDPVHLVDPDRSDQAQRGVLEVRTKRPAPTVPTVPTVTRAKPGGD